MHDLFDLLLHPSLAERPDRVFMVAGAFAALAVLALSGRKLRTPIRLRFWPCLAVAAVWALYGWWEAGLQGKGYNIRVDLIFIHPLLTILSVMAVAGLVWRPRRRIASSESRALPTLADQRSPGAGQDGPPL